MDKDALAHVTAHELTHLLLNEQNSATFDNEHPTTAEKKHLMYYAMNNQNRKKIIFDDATRKAIDLTSKESAERKAR